MTQLSRISILALLLVTMAHAENEERSCKKKVIRADKVCADKICAGDVHVKNDLTVEGNTFLNGDLTVSGTIFNPGLIALENRAACLEAIAAGFPTTPASNGNADVYPINGLPGHPLAPNVFLSVATGLSRLAPSMGPLRQCPEVFAANGGTWFRNDTDECWIAVNPTNVNNMIIVTHQDRWTGAPFIFGGIFLSDIILYTLDGGVTWNEADVTTAKCQNPTLPFSNSDFDSASDPYVTFDANGNAYMVPLCFNIFDNVEEAIVLLKSTDGGQSWNKPTTITRDDGNSNFQERDTLTANPYRPNVLYSVWPNELALLGEPASVVNFQRSTNGGTTWNSPKSIITTPVSDQTPLPFPWGPILKVLPDVGNTLVVGVVSSYNLDDASPEGQQQFIVARSSDGGDSWTSNVIFPNADFPVFAQASIVDPGTGDFIGANFGGIDIALNPNILPNGQLYGVFQTLYPGVTPGQGGSMITTSLDGGVTWSNPLGIDTGAFFPTVAVADDGVVGVLFYSFRNHIDPNSPSLETDVFPKLYSSDLSTVISETRLTPISFDYRQAIWRLDNLFLGDYQKLQASGNDFVACFTVTNPPYGVGTTPRPGTVFTADSRYRQETLFMRYSRS